MKLRSIALIAACVISGFAIGRVTAPASADRSQEVRNVAGWPAKIDKRAGTFELLRPKQSPIPFEPER